MRIKMIGRGTFYNVIRSALGNHRINQCHIAVNYGVQGDRLRDYQRRYPAINALPMLNSRQHGNKYQCVVDAIAAGVSAPESRTRNDLRGDVDAWIRKPYYSSGGRDIHRHVSQDVLPDTHYLQAEITNRRYEVRVHAMAWIDPSRWIMQKRVHEDGDTQLTWNHHTGGTFITIENTEDALFQRIRADVITLMRTFNYQFGAVDFIVTNSPRRGEALPHYFIEWNLAPGFTLDHVRDYYISAFEALQRIEMDTVTQMLEGGTLSQSEWVQPDSAEPEIEDDAELVDIEELDQQPEVASEPSTTDPVVSPPQPTRERATIINTAPIPSADEIALREQARLQAVLGTSVPPEYDPTHSIPLPEMEVTVDDSADYEAHMAEMAEEVNFCHGCGRSIAADIFGGVPRYCRGCGQQVRS